MYRGKDVLACQAYSSASLFRLSHSFLSFVAIYKQYRFKSVRSMDAMSRNQSRVELDADWNRDKTMYIMMGQPN